MLSLMHIFLDRRHKATKKVKIGLVGKYDLQDAYKSILEALSQAATYNDRKADIHCIKSEKLTDANVEEQIKEMDGIIICPGFGQRGIEGKFVAIDEVDIRFTVIVSGCL